MKTLTKFWPLTILDTGAWAFKGGFCVYVISTKILFTGPKRSIRPELSLLVDL